MVKKRNITLVVGLVALLISGCAKQRSNFTLDSDSLTYKRKSLYEGKICAIQTTDSIFKSNITSSKEVDAFDSEELTSRVNYFVSSKDPECSLIPTDLPLVLKKNTKYKVRYDLSNNFLTLVLIGKAENFPFEYMEFATSKGSNREVQIFGYPVSYYKYVASQNGDGQDMSLERPHLVHEKEEADLINFDPFNGTALSVLTKSDVIRKEFFQGEWYSSMIVSGSSVESKVPDGVMLNPMFDAQYPLFPVVGLKTVEFKMDEEFRLTVVDMNVDKDLEFKDLEKQVVYSFPIESIAYRRKSIRTSGDMQELKDDSVHWTDRPHVKVGYEGISIYNKGIDLLKNRLELRNLSIQKDYIGIKYYDVQDNIEYLLSFVKKEESPLAYEPKPMHPKDGSLFGVFHTGPKELYDHQRLFEKDFYSHVRLTRFNPNRSEIVYHLTHNSPTDQVTVDTAKNTMLLWSKVFEKIGSSIRFRLSEERVNAGDIRYNILNMVDDNVTRPKGGMIGFGPFFPDQQTGEIITAQSNVWVGPIKLGFFARLYNLFRSEVNVLDFDPSIDQDISNYGESQITGSSEAPTSLALSGHHGIPLMEARAMPNGTSSGFQFIPAPINFQNMESKLSEMFKPINSFAANVSAENEDRPSTFRKFQNSPSMSVYNSEDIENIGFDSFDSLSEAFSNANGRKDILKLMSQTGQLDHQFHQKIETSYDGLRQAVKEECSELTSYMKTIRAKKYEIKDVFDQIWNCTNIIYKETYLLTSVHEVYHNLGGMHNPGGTAEANEENIWSTESALSFFDNLELWDNGSKKPLSDFLKSGQKAVTSSVMDYFDTHFSRTFLNSLPGPQDVATMLYLYEDSIEVPEGNSGEWSVEQLDTAVPVLDQHTRNEFRNYNFCNFYDMYEDPMCAMFDIGKTPLEAVQYYRKRFFDRFKFSRERGDLAFARNEFYSAFGRFYYDLVPAYKIYTFWRMEQKRLTSFFEYSDPYFKFYNIDTTAPLLNPTGSALDPDYENPFLGKINHYQTNLVKPVLKKVESQPHIESLYSASREAFKFFHDVANMKNRYCFVEDNETRKVFPVELSKLLETDAFVSSGRSDDIALKGCSDKSFRNIFNGTGISIVRNENRKYEVGYQLKTQKTNLGRDSEYEDPRIAGSFFDRILASFLLTTRMPVFMKQIEDRYFPAFIDEPDLRVILKDTIESRISDGVPMHSSAAYDAILFHDYAAPGINELKQKHLTESAPTLPDNAYELDLRRAHRFDKESHLILSQYMLYLNGLVTPDMSLDQLYGRFARYLSDMTLESFFKDSDSFKGRYSLHRSIGRIRLYPFTADKNKSFIYDLMAKERVLDRDYVVQVSEEVDVESILNNILEPLVSAEEDFGKAILYNPTNPSTIRGYKFAENLIENVFGGKSVASQQTKLGLMEAYFARETNPLNDEQKVFVEDLLRLTFQPELELVQSMKDKTAIESGKYSTEMSLLNRDRKLNEETIEESSGLIALHAPKGTTSDANIKRLSNMVETTGQYIDDIDERIEDRPALYFEQIRAMELDSVPTYGKILGKFYYDYPDADEVESRINKVHKEMSNLADYHDLPLGFRDWDAYSNLIERVMLIGVSF